MRRGAAAIVAMLVLGCGGTDATAGPETPLRDILAMEPDDVRALPLATRLDLRARFERAMRDQSTAETIDDHAEPTSMLLVVYDAPAALRGDDATVLLVAEREAGLATFHTVEALAPDAGPHATPPVDFEIDDPLLEGLEDVIDGPARPWLELAANETGVTVIGAAPAAPAAVIADANRVLVNPSWLALYGSVVEATPVHTASFAHHDDPVRTNPRFGCYGSCDWDCFDSLGCTCNYCGFDWGLCASECGPEGEGCHCHAARPPRPSGSPLDPIFVVLPAAYLALRRRRR